MDRAQSSAAVRFSSSLVEAADLYGQAVAPSIDENGTEFIVSDKDGPLYFTVPLAPNARSRRR